MINYDDDLKLFFIPKLAMTLHCHLFMIVLHATVAMIMMSLWKQYV